MGLLNQIGMANPSLVFSHIDAENLRKKQVADMERWRQEQQAFQREQAGLMAPYRQLQARSMQQQIDNYRTPEQQQEAEIEAYRRKQEIENRFRKPEKPQLVVSNDEYGNPRFFLYDATGIRQVGGSGGGSTGGQQPPGQMTPPVPSAPVGATSAQPQQPAPPMSTKQPQTMGLNIGPKTSGGLLSGFLSAPVPQTPQPGPEAYSAPTSSPARAKAQGQTQTTDGTQFQVGRTYDASGSAVNAPGMARYENPQDMRMPDGSLKSVQWDKLGRFYRILGDATKPDPESKPLPFEQASKLAGLKNAYSQVQSLAGGLFDQDGKFKRGTAAMAMLPGTPEAKYEKQAYQAVEAWLRAMSGAAVPESEVKRYMDAYMPRPWDDPTVARDKLSRMQAQYTETMGLMGRPMKQEQQQPQGGVLRYNPKTGRFE